MVGEYRQLAAVAGEFLQLVEAVEYRELWEAEGFRLEVVEVFLFEIKYISLKNLVL